MHNDNEETKLFLEELEKPEEYEVNGDTIYTTGEGLECILIKSFNENEHIIQYIFDQEVYDHDYDSYYGDIGYSKDMYYKGSLQVKKNFEIKKDKRYQQLKDEIKELELKKNKLSHEISSLNSDLRTAIKESEKLAPLKNLFEFIDGSKNFLFATSGWGFRIFDLRTEKEITNVDDEDNCYEDIFNYHQIKYHLTINLGNYGNHRTFKPYLELKSNNYKVKDTNFDSCYTIELFDSIEDILTFVHEKFKTKEFNLDFLKRIYSYTRKPLPEDVQQYISEQNKAKLAADLEARKKEALQKQKEADEIQAKLKAYEKANGLLND